MAWSAEAKDRISKIIENVVRTRFSDSHLTVEVVPGEDSDGDEIIRVAVIFELAGQLIDTDKMSGLVRHLKTALSDAALTDAFPLVRYISSEDKVKRKLEPA